MSTFDTCCSVADSSASRLRAASPHAGAPAGGGVASHSSTARCTASNAGSPSKRSA